jgi:Glycosyltransferase sugar-binding region containing DXD motif
MSMIDPNKPIIVAGNTTSKRGSITIIALFVIVLIVILVPTVLFQLEKEDDYFVNSINNVDRFNSNDDSSDESSSKSSHNNNNNNNNNIKSNNLLLHSDPNNRIIGQHHHVIPAILTFTHQYNLLTEVFPYSNVSDYESLTDKEREMLALQQNVHDIMALHPESKVRFLNDTDCVESIRTVMMILYNNNSIIANEMIEFFNKEPEGMYKGDICRGAALYETGGLYFDVDIAVRMSVWALLNPTTEFITVIPAVGAGFFQAFIGVPRAHPIMARYMTLFIIIIKVPTQSKDI